MSAEAVALWLVTIAAIPQTLFVLIYGARSPWWRSQVGRAIFTKALALALLLDVSLIGYWLMPIPPVIANAVVAVVAVGSWLQLLALIAEKVRAGRTDQGFDSDN